MVFSGVTVVCLAALDYAHHIHDLHRNTYQSQVAITIRDVHVARLQAYLIERRPDATVQPIYKRKIANKDVKKKKKSVEVIATQIVQDKLVPQKQIGTPVAIASKKLEPKPIEVIHMAAPEVQPVEDEHVEISEFPAFGNAVHPVAKVPNWGAMRTPSEWNRVHNEMGESDFVRIPRYNLSVLTQPLAELAKQPIKPENIPALTAKLYYSTRFFGRYDLDSSEFEAPHPGIDLKLPMGTPVGVVAGGSVHRVFTGSRLGLCVMVEHRIAGKIFFSMYGHLGKAWVKEGQAVNAGQAIGTVGMTGNTTGPHIHLQIDRDIGIRPHQPYQPSAVPSIAEASLKTIHPIDFISRY